LCTTFIYYIVNLLDRRHTINKPIHRPAGRKGRQGDKSSTGRGERQQREEYIPSPAKFLDQQGGKRSPRGKSSTDRGEKQQRSPRGQILDRQRRKAAKVAKGTDPRQAEEKGSKGRNIPSPAKFLDQQGGKVAKGQILDRQMRKAAKA